MAALLSFTFIALTLSVLYDAQGCDRRMHYIPIAFAVISSLGILAFYILPAEF